MNHMVINGESFGSNDLIRFVISELTGLGVSSFLSISIDAQQNRISIQFDDKVDADIVRAIVGLPEPTKNKHFQSNDAKLFMLALHETSAQEGFC